MCRLAHTAEARIVGKNWLSEIETNWALLLWALTVPVDCVGWGSSTRNALAPGNLTTGRLTDAIFCAKIA
jgi:hypothetical protein